MPHMAAGSYRDSDSEDVNDGDELSEAFRFGLGSWFWCEVLVFFCLMVFVDGLVLLVWF